MQHFKDTINYLITKCYISSVKHFAPVLTNYHVFCSQLYLSTRRGAWILNRVGEKGFPLDLQFNRVMFTVQRILPFSFFCSLGERQLNQRFNHSLYNLRPKHRYCTCICSDLWQPNTLVWRKIGPQQAAAPSQWNMHRKVRKMQFL